MSCTTTMHLVEINAQPIEGETNGLPMVREALTALGLAVFVSGILGVLIYLGADALIGSGSCSKRYNERQTRCLRPRYGIIASST
jgi:hypothetical protein